MKTDSEFACDMVKVTRVEKHPNADRLELVHFTFDGEHEYPGAVVCGKGDFSPAESVVYISPDSTVPLSHPKFAFLTARLDAKGKARYRIRSARIRGVYSPGLIVAADRPEELGFSFAEELDVKPYETAQEVERHSTSVHFKAGYKLTCPYPVYSVDSLKKVPWLFEEGERVSVTEKIHGTNFRFGTDNGRFFYGSHRMVLSDTRGLFRRIWDFFMGRRIYLPGGVNVWKKAVEQYELEEVCRNWDGLIFYGELFGPGVQDLNYSQAGLSLRIFDIWSTTDGRYLTVSERNLVISSCQLWTPISKPVPKLYEGPYSFDMIRRLAEEQSVFGGIREGVVVESLEGQRRKGKWVSEQYHLRSTK